MTIPADILAANAAGRIPKGISLSYLAQSRDHSAIVGIIFLACLTGLTMGLRLYARLFLVKRMGLDDALAVLTLVSMIDGHAINCRDRDMNLTNCPSSS